MIASFTEKTHRKVVLRDEEEMASSILTHGSMRHPARFTARKLAVKCEV